jgi:hypothetical protein
MVPEVLSNRADEAFLKGHVPDASLNDVPLWLPILQLVPIHDRRVIAENDRFIGANNLIEIKSGSGVCMYNPQVPLLAIMHHINMENEHHTKIWGVGVIRTPPDMIRTRPVKAQRCHLWFLMHRVKNHKCNVFFSLKLKVPRRRRGTCLEDLL